MHSNEKGPELRTYKLSQAEEWFSGYNFLMKLGIPVLWGKVNKLKIK